MVSLLDEDVKEGKLEGKQGVLGKRKRGKDESGLVESADEVRGTLYNLVNLIQCVHLTPSFLFSY